MVECRHWHIRIFVRVLHPLSLDPQVMKNYPKKILLTGKKMSNRGGITLRDHTEAVCPETLLLFEYLHFLLLCSPSCLFALPWLVSPVPLLSSSCVFNVCVPVTHNHNSTLFKRSSLFPEFTLPVVLPHVYSVCVCPCLPLGCRAMVLLCPPGYKSSCLRAPPIR